VGFGCSDTARLLGSNVSVRPRTAAVAGGSCIRAAGSFETFWSTYDALALAASFGNADSKVKSGTYSVLLAVLFVGTTSPLSSRCALMHKSSQVELPLLLVGALAAALVAARPR